MKNLRNSSMVTALILTGIIFFVSCKKDDDQEPNTCSTSTEYLSADITKLKLKKNTYWVFLDSISMTTDSVYIDSIMYSGMFSKAKCATEKYEAYSFRTRTSTSSTQMDYYQLKGGNFSRNPVNTSDLEAAVYVDYGLGTVTGSSLTLLRKDSVFIYDRYYKNVEIITNPTDKTELRKTIYYTNSEFGLLKKETYTSGNALLSKKVLKSKNIIR